MSDSSDARDLLIEPVGVVRQEGLYQRRAISSQPDGVNKSCAVNAHEECGALEQLGQSAEVEG